MAANNFDPTQHLRSIKGSDYLEVKWRIAWLRAEDPEARLETTLYEHDGDHAVFSARVELTSGAVATGWGSETRLSFENYLEKAETRAIGRALAAVGFGTQFCGDFEDIDSPADTPVQRQLPREDDGPRRPVMEMLRTDKQANMIHALVSKGKFPARELDTELERRYGQTMETLSKRNASNFIDGLQRSGSVRDNDDDRFQKGAA